MKEKFFIPLDQKALNISSEQLISRQELEELIQTYLVGKLKDNFGLNSGLYMSDMKYYCPSYSEAEAIINGSDIEDMCSSFNSEGVERFDCDDFSLLLKARFAEAAYLGQTASGSPVTKCNFAHCFGIVWGMLPIPLSHSMNWVVTAGSTGEKTFHFIEPQEAKILTEAECTNFQNIYFMLV